MRPIGPSREYTRTSCVRLVHREILPTRPSGDPHHEPRGVRPPQQFNRGVRAQMRPIGPLREYTHASCVRLVRREIYPRVLRPIGPS
eukprot:9489854-Pyramimonas_sp.AAC.3